MYLGVQRPKHDHAVSGMADDVRCRLGHDDRQAANGIGAQAPGVPQLDRGPARRTDLRLLIEYQQRRWAGRVRRPNGCGQAFHRTIVTQVPSEGVESRSNSLTNRLAPGNPIPIPPPVVYPSCMARSIPEMPGP